MIIVLEYFTPTLMLDQFNFTIFVNGIAVQLSQILSILPSYFFINKITRRKLAIVSLLIIGLSSIVMIFIWDQDKSDITDIWSNIAVIIFVFIISLAIASEYNFFVVYINELYPAQVRIIGVGFIKSFGGGALMFSSLIIQLCLDTGFKIMILFTILAAIAIYISYILPESFQIAPPEVIKELRPQKGSTAED